jgi:adenosylmethionine-8-amino-7-oxononanoate aminotransferase
MAGDHDHRIGARGQRLFDRDAKELVGEVRTIGLLAGVEVNGDVADRVAEEAFKRGVIVRVLRGTVLQISPPFVISEEQLGTIASVLEESLVAA